MITDASTRPAPVTLAVKLVIVMAVLGVLGGVAVFADLGALREQAVAAAGANQAVADTAVTVAVASGVAGAVIGAAVWLVFGLLAGRGRGWARIVVTVLAALTVLSGLTALASPALLLVVGLLRLVVAVAVVVLLFRPESNRWFAQVKAARQVGATGYPPVA